MSEPKKEVRNKWLHLRLSETEHKTISNNWQKTTSKQLSDYARRVLLKKPVVVNYRNQSADEILAEMIRLKNELHTVGNNFNQAVNKLQALDTVPQIKGWLLLNENIKNAVLKKTEEIQLRLQEIYIQWSQK